MKAYALTKLGKRVINSSGGTSEERVVMSYIRENRVVTDDTLNTITDGGGYIVRGLVRGGFVKELSR